MVTGKVALVTGGTRGIGAAVGRGLADEGASIAAGYWHGHEGAEKFGAAMSAEYPQQHFTLHEGNIGHADDCRQVVREVIDQHGHLDILVNNAGITIDRTVAKMSDEDWLRVLSVNLSGAFFIAQAALDHMIERGTGRIINMSSAIGETGNIGQANYAASKSGLFGLTKSLAREAIFQLNRAQRPAGDGIGVSLVSSASWRLTSLPTSPGRSRWSTAAWICDGNVMNDLGDVVVDGRRADRRVRRLPHRAGIELERVHRMRCTPPFTGAANGQWACAPHPW
jgi:acetoacetyl-CoA reductase/3-oxoacyl-[acyl-carrier protein] reductase